MNIDAVKVRRYLTEMTKSSHELESLILENTLTPDSLVLKAAKYILIELAETIANILQHLLAKEKGIAVNGYIDAIVKAHQSKIISEPLFDKLKPFLDFRNSLIHRYWAVDDTLLIRNIREGYQDFFQFITEIEAFLQSLEAINSLKNQSTEESYPCP